MSGADMILKQFSEITHTSNGRRAAVDQTTLNPRCHWVSGVGEIMVIITQAMKWAAPRPRPAWSIRVLSQLSTSSRVYEHTCARSTYLMCT